MHIATEENNLMTQKDEKEKEKNGRSVIQPEKQPNDSGWFFSIQIILSINELSFLSQRKRRIQ